jgi:L-lactate dehydrogenase
VVIVGAGRVGATFAYTLLLSGLVGEIVLIDVDRERAKGEVMDLNHAMSLARPVRLWAGDYEDCAGADVVAITAGVSQRPGDTRLDLVKRNAAILREILPQITAHNQSGILLIATNPVDVLCCLARLGLSHPESHRIGDGSGYGPVPLSAGPAPGS